ncbi:hypothetical protein [Lacticaseibacillus sp. GG6-2]
MTSVRFLTNSAENIEITTTTSRVLINCGLVSGALPNLPELFDGTSKSNANTAIVIPAWRAGHIEAIPALNPDVPIYGQPDTPLETPVALGDLTISPALNALLVDDGDHLYGYATSALMPEEATALATQFAGRKLKMLFLATTANTAVAVCNALASEIVVAPTEALSETLDAQTRAMILQPEPELFYTVDAD